MVVEPLEMELAGKHHRSQAWWRKCHQERWLSAELQLAWEPLAEQVQCPSGQLDWELEVMLAELVQLIVLVVKEAGT